MVTGDEPKSQKWVKEFAKCPLCGSEERMFERMWQEMVERGLAPEGMKFYYDLKSGALANDQIMAKLPIGAEIPGYGVATDICLGCGLIYAVKLEASRATKGLAPVQITPNRAQRRAGVQGFILPS